MSRAFQRRRLAGLALVLFMVAGACGGDDDGSAASSSTVTSEVDDRDKDGSDQDASDSAVDTVTSEEADLDLPRSVTYAGVELELTGATFSNASPATFNRPEPSIGSDVLLFIELTTRFSDGYPGDDSFLPARHFVIETAAGDRLPATGVDFLAEVPVLTSADSDVVLSFEAGPDDLDGAVFVYDDTERVAARLPLTGAVPDSEYPLSVAVNGVAVPHLATGCEPVPTEVQLVTVEWDIDGGVAIDGTKLARGRSSRASVDHRFLRTMVEVTAGTGQCGGTFANQETFRLLADGTAIAPLNTYSLTLADGEVAPMTFLFELPVDSDEVALEAGARGAETATFTIEVPDLP